MIRAALPAAALAAALLLTGCSGAGPGITAATSTALEQEVRAVAGLAAAHRYPAALTAAATLRGDLTAAVAAGSVSDERAKRIRGALTLVETDLRTAQAASKPARAPARTPTPTPTATPTPTPTPTRTAATTRVASAPTVTPTTDARRTAAAVRKAIDAARKAAEQQRGRWHGKGKRHGDDD